MTGGGLDTNSAPLGGALFVSGKGAGTTPGMGTLDGVAVTNNVADGGTSATGGNGGAIFSSGALTIRNHSAFSGNRVVKSSASGAISGYGGAIFDGPLGAGDAPAATVNDSTISGGAIPAGTTNAVVGGAIATLGNIFGSAASSTPG